jgi:hypothetical protein
MSGGVMSMHRKELLLFCGSLLDSSAASQSACIWCLSLVVVQYHSEQYHATLEDSAGASSMVRAISVCWGGGDRPAGVLLNAACCA